MTAARFRYGIFAAAPAASVSELCILFTIALVLSLGRDNPG
jgi:hypothetical protein